jgi:periplasmic copper chaperone A
VSKQLLLLSACAAALLSLSACDAVLTSQPEVEEVAGGNLMVSEPSIRLNPNAAAPSAAYFTLTGGAMAQVLTGVSSPDLERAELHESKMEGGMMTMAAMPEVAVPAGGTVIFRQGGKHVMLFGISDAARAAGQLTLTLAFKDGQTVPVDVPLTAVGEAAATDEHAGH